MPRKATRAPLPAATCRCANPLAVQDQPDEPQRCIACGHDLGEMRHPDDRANPTEWGPLSCDA